MQHKNLPQQDPIIEWSAPEHLHHKRTKTWYISAAACVAFCIIYSVLTHAWTFTFLIVAIAAIYWKTHGLEENTKQIRIWRSGFAIDNRYSEWGECKGYWILKGPGYYEVHFKKHIGGEVKIQTGDVDPYTLHELLPSMIAELEGQKENTLDTIIRICKL